MIITCENCFKKFNIEDNLITDQGRLLQCGSCQHKWFYKIHKEQNVPIHPAKETLNIIKTNTENNIENKKIYKNIDKLKKKKNKPKVIKNTLVLIISIFAMIILLDTFKHNLNNYIPGINSILNNLYEILKDLSLFLKDIFN
tara:strand:- start:318 stop:743 length:426 start_codon:yes stop_codon:yes gene_type:complete